LNVEVVLQGTFHYSVYRQYEDTEENKALYEGKFDPEKRSVVEGKDFLNVTERESEPFDRIIAISALEAEGSYFQHEQGFFDRVYGEPVVKYKVGIAKYEDMFGNKYATQYLDEELDRYEWHQPRHLRIPNPESR
jgi:hypothetical protein